MLLNLGCGRALRQLECTESGALNSKEEEQLTFHMLRHRGQGHAMPSRLGRTAGGVLLASIACLAVSSAPAMAATKKSAAKPALKLMAQYSSNNPAIANLSDIYGVTLAYSELIHQNPNGTFAPELASSWKYLGGHDRTFQVTLRKGAEFADGSPITASSVAAWLRYFAKTSTVAANLGKITSIKVVNKQTFRIFLAAADPVLPYALSDQSTAGIASGKCAANPGLFTSDPKVCGSGEYVYVTSGSVPAVHANFVPNPHFYDPAAVKFSKASITYVADPASAVQGLQSGEFNVIEGEGTTAGAALSSGHKVYTGGEQLQVNLTLDAGGAVSKPLSNVLVRQAINYALNRKALAEVFGGAYASPTDELITADGYDPKLNNYYAYNPSKAKALMKQAGYANGFTLNNVIAPTFDPAWTGLEGEISANLSAIGITLNTTDEPQLPGWIQAIATSTNSPMEIVAGSLVPMWVEYSTDIPFENHFGGTGWHDATLGRDFSIGLTSKNPTPYWTAITDRLVKGAFFAPMAVQKVLLYADKDVKGIDLTATRTDAPPTEWSIS
jgi:peptide/nickel transport system substrate-binding protein